MRELCAKADIIIPNITEAVFMLDEPYQEDPYTKDYIESLLKRLSDIGTKQIVLTGVHFDGEQLGAAALIPNPVKLILICKLDRRILSRHRRRFGSALVAALLKGCDLVDATAEAVRFTVSSISRTKAAGTDIRFGVDFESGLGELAARLDKKAN